MEIEFIFIYSTLCILSLYTINNYINKYVLKEIITFQKNILNIILFKIEKLSKEQNDIIIIDTIQDSLSRINSILRHFLKTYIEKNIEELDKYKPKDINISNNINFINIPNEFKCPISRNIMKNPVILSDGHSYDRIYIEEYIKDKPISPITNKPLIFPYLIPNWNLRKLITSYVLYNENSESIINENFDNENLFINNYDKKIINISNLLNQQI